jgi:hypothetical protein
LRVAGAIGEGRDGATVGGGRERRWWLNGSRVEGC